MPDHLILIRAGATAYEAEGRIRGTLDLPLCAIGGVEAEQAARLLAAAPPDALYTSTARCALETARIVGRGCKLRPRRLADLGNLDFGLWQGMLVEEIERKQPRLARQWQEHPWSVVPPEGESLDEARDRVESALETVARRHPGGRVALVVPTPLDRLVHWLLHGAPLGDLWQRPPAPETLLELPLAAQWREADPTQRPPRRRATPV